MVCNAEEGSSPLTPEQLLDAQVERYLKNFPEGLKFQPSDEEAVLYYLVKRSRNEQLPNTPIKEVNIYGFTPEDLLDRYKNYGIERKELYVFTPRERKYPNGRRPGRCITGRYVGFWRIAGPAKEIRDTDRTPIGVRRSLNFYKGTKDEHSDTPFTMHEYILEYKIDSKSGQQDGRKKQEPVNLALCKIWNKQPENILSPVAKSSSEITDTNLLENANTEYNSSEPVMGARQGSSSINMVMPTDNENSSHPNGFLQRYHIEDATNSYGEMGVYQDSSTLMNMLMPNDGNFSNINRSLQDHMAMEETFVDPFRTFGDNYLTGGKQNGELQVALNQENKFESSVLRNDFYFSGSSSANQ
ncbi:protein ATAF2-like [Papaver somniferum]|uniref:protein ATAF2-like n=1 Tax=Papaver somniferum TaxID=3469 RepID=UPI000E7045D5|nr:protein ATAF2-like [Papaver somniferum]